MSITVKKPGKSLISAGALARIHTCAHFWHLQCFGDATLVTEPDAGAQLRMDAGISHEDEVIAKLKVVQPEYPEDKPWEGIEPTLELMRKGVPLIYQGVLKNGRAFGLPDLLEKTKGKSKLGSFSYRPVDIKSHAKVTSKDKLQLGAYSFMLQEALGFMPLDGAIILKDQSRANVDLGSEISKIQSALAQALSVEKKKVSTLPLRCSECGICPWSDHCDSDRKDQKLVTVLSGMNSRLMRKLIDGGVATYDRLAKLTPNQVAKRFDLGQDRANEIHLNAQAWHTNKPLLKAKVKLPPVRQTIIYYDIETYGETLYLHGLFIDNGKKTEVRQFAAQAIEDEEKILIELLSFLSHHSDAVIYTWTTFEDGWMSSMAERYPKHEKVISRMLKQLVDLKEVVKEALVLPVTTFSIKEVAPVFGFKWRAEDAGGSDSEAWYDEWLNTKDKDLFTKILHYNEDDVIAMHVIMTELREILRRKSA
jgi:uncharacterized protein